MPGPGEYHPDPSQGIMGCTSAFVFFCCDFADFGATGERVARAIA
jgi:hypothetical protein